MGARTKPDAVTDGMIWVLEAACVRQVRCAEKPRPFGVCRRRGLIRNGVITHLGREILATVDRRERP